MNTSKEIKELESKLVVLRHQQFLEIERMRREGLSLKEIGERVGLTRQRVFQILKQYEK